MHNKKLIRAATAIMPFFVGLVVSSYSQREVCDDASVERDLAKMAADFNKRLPLQVDSLTRLDRIEAGPGKKYAYIYTIGKQLTDEEKRLIKETTTRRALEAPDMEPIFRSGVTVWYKYYNPAGGEMCQFSVRNTALAEQTTSYNTGYKVGYLVGAFIGALAVGLFCGLLPLFLAIRRGRPKLAAITFSSCILAGLALGAILAIPAALIFAAVILALPRVVRKTGVAEAQMVS